MRIRKSLFPFSASLFLIILLITLPSKTASDKGFSQSPGTSSFTCTPTIQWYWNGGSVASQVVVVNLTDDNGDGTVDGNDKPEVAFIGRIIDQLWVVDGTTGNTIPGFPVGSFGSTGLAAADLLGDPVAELIAVTDNGLGGQRIEIYDRSGTLVANGPYYDELARPNNHFATISVANIDTLHRPEILIGELVFDSTGTKIWFGTEGQGVLSSPPEPSRTSTGVDLNLDGDLEVLAGKTAYNPDGTVFWTFGGVSGSDGASAVGNYDCDNYPEVVFVYNDTIRLLDHLGNAIGAPYEFGHGGEPGGSYHSGVFTALGQFDGDLEPEVAETDGDSLWALNFDPLSLNWSKFPWAVNVRDASTRSGLSIADLDNDGIDEIIYRDEDTLRIVDGGTGEVEFKYPIESFTGVEYPVAADIDGDDTMEVVVTSEDGVYAFYCDTWVDGRRVWNDYTYHVTNINEDGTVPVHQDTSWLRYNSFLAQESGPFGGGQFGPWTIEIVQSGTEGHYNAIDLREDTYPHISFHDEIQVGLWYAYKDTIPPCGLFPQWKVFRVDSGDVGYWTSIRMPPLSPIAFFSYVNFQDWDIRYAGTVVGIDSVGCEITIAHSDVDTQGDLGTSGTDLALDSQGLPCIVYYDSTNGNLKYAERHPSGAGDTLWDTVTVDGQGGVNVGKYPSIAIHPITGRRHVSYYDETNGDLKYAFCNPPCLTPGSWTKQTLDDPFPDPINVGGFTQIAVDQLNVGHVSYINFTDQSVQYINTAFGAPKIVENSSNDLVASTSIGNITLNQLHISYSDRTVKTLKYSRSTNNGLNWTLFTVPDPWNDVGLWNSIAVSDGDTVHISYSSSDSQCGFRALKYAKGKP